MFSEGGSASGYLVEVGSAHRIAPGIEALPARFHGKDIDVSREAVVKRNLQLARAATSFSTEMRRLRERMNACIGASGASQFKRTPEGFSCRSFYLACYRAGVLLLLPAAIPGSLVFDG